jgi:SAM-dependent methyltransferase
MLPMNHLKIDLGCGNCKKKGTLGIDSEAFPDVDFVLDLQNQPLPFPDRSVQYVYSSHFLEHLEDPASVFAEISRVCEDGAKVELWTPFAWSNPAFIFGHKFFFTEEIYLHLCVMYPEIWTKIFKARWYLKEIIYCINPNTLSELNRNGISLDFALKHYVNIVSELGILIEVHHDHTEESFTPLRTFAFNRTGERYPIKSTSENNIFFKFHKVLALIREMGIKKFLTLVYGRLRHSS